MFKFFQIVGIIISMLLTFFTFVYLVRLGTTSDNTFIGTSDIANYISQVDFQRIFKKMVDEITSIVNEFQKQIDKVANFPSTLTFNSPSYIAVNNPADFFSNIGRFFNGLVSLFSQVFYAIGELFKIVGFMFLFILYPIRVLIYLIEYLVYFFQVFFGFINLLFA